MTEDCIQNCQSSHSKDTIHRMCLSTLTPAISRMRHWSCPEKLPSSCVLDDDDTAENVLKCPEAEDVPDMNLDNFARVDLRFRVLAAWEERVLSLREARKSRLRPNCGQAALKTIQSDNRDNHGVINVDANEEISSCNLPTSNLTDDTSSEKLVTTTMMVPKHSMSRVSNNSETNLKLEFSHRFQSSTIAHPPPDLISSLDKSRALKINDRVTKETQLTAKCEDWTGIMSENSNCRPDSLSEARVSVTQDLSESTTPAPSPCRSQSHVSNISEACRQSIRICSYNLKYSLSSILLLLPFLFKFCSSRIPSSKALGLHSKKAPDKVRKHVSFLWFTLLTLLVVVCPSSCVEDDHFLPLGFPPADDEGPLCTDGILRGSIMINNKDDPGRGMISMNSLWKYENCSVVEGHISITSAVYEMTDTDTDNPGNYSLPNLVEVTDYVVLYRAEQINSLETLFPRLSVIRGHKLIHSYALAIYQTKRMVRVGLPSLTHIMNGGVRIEKNPLLCYVDTIDWKKIVVRESDKNAHIVMIDNQEPNKCLDKCPSKCSNCWSSSDCQRELVPCPGGTNYENQEMCYRNNKGEEGRPCHPECIGGCEDTEEAINNPGACVACNHTRNKNPSDPLSFTCLASCPRPLVAYKQWMCITEDECSQSQVFGFPMYSMDSEAKSVYKVYNDQCVDKCPNGFIPEKNRAGIWKCIKCENDNNCPVHCDGENINSPESAKKLKSCTHINGDLVINVNRGEVTKELEENLQYIEEISGQLKIERSHSLVSLHFFKSLKKIGGMVDGGTMKSQKTLTIFENDNLQKLFPDNQVLDMGSNAVVFIHYNQKLCKKEITEFLEKSGVKEVGEHSVSSYSNGNKIVCSEEKLNLIVESGSPDLLRLQYKNYYQNLESLGDIDVNSLLGYHIYYREITEDQFMNKSITRYEGMDACGGSAWNVYFEEDPQKYTSYEPSEFPCNGCLSDPEVGLYIKPVHKDAYTYIHKVKPYTPYAIYVETVMEKALAGRATGAQSDIVYARTKESNPSTVTNLLASSPSPNTLEVSWRSPSKPNGIIDKYYIEVSYLDSGYDAEERNYCDQKPEKEKEKPSKVVVEPTPDTILDGQCPACEKCNKKDDMTEPVAPKTDKVLDEKAFYDDIINSLFVIHPSVAITDDEMHPDPFSRRKRSVSGLKSANSVSKDDSLKPKENESFISIQSQRDGPIKNLSEANRTMTSGYMARVLISLPGNMTQVTINRLRHYTDYEIRVFACQKIKSDKLGEYRACSDEAILNTKTAARREADDILTWTSDYDLYTLSGNGSEGIIKWFPPADPNGWIVNYVLSRSPDASTSNVYKKCISMREIIKSREDINGEERDVMTYRLTENGEYYIRLQAVSLYQEGSPTKFQFVRVNSNKSSIVVTIVVLFFVLLILGMAMFGGYAYWKKKKSPDWTFASRNDNYIDTSEIYVVDDWEVKREDIDMMEELGKGSFGMVYRGLYKHPEKGDIACAVKTVNKESTYRQKIEFLHEASVMKDYNTEHVIKLLGVVSEGQPALVLMELMENGDLKNYLRSLRPDSENNRLRRPPPTLSEVLQMAIEIADGMSYLSVKKIVHRDLAARNCMVADNIVVKVGDFGMARDIYETEYYRKQGRGLLPVRWMAPESIKDGKFTSQSDVWSFGVVLWEMATLAEQPYQGFTNDEVMKYVKDGNKMKRPENCPDILFDLMSDCWHLVPDDRPTFLQICKRLLDKANDRWRETCFFLTPEGNEAVINQEEMFQLRREQEESSHADPSTPLTGGGGQGPGHNGNSSNGVADNGHLAPGGPTSGESHPLVNLRPNARSPTQVYFSSESGYSSGSRGGSRGRLSMNGIVQRFRNMSGSTSGEA